MSYDMNLIPLAYRNRLRRGRTRRSVAVALAISGLAIGAVGWSLHAAVLHRRAELEDLKLFVADMRAVAADARALEDRIAQLNDELDAQGELQHPVQVSAMMATLCGLMPDSVTLDSMELRASLRSIEPGAGKGASSKSETQDQHFMVCEVTGVARSDLDVADFVGRLTDHPLYQEVALDYSRPHTVRGISGRTFRISCNVDLDRRYDVTTLPTLVRVTAADDQSPAAEASDGQ